ncbi:MAG TPA: AsmA family protein [Burkholderiales bacterium]|nr:AsmA family protein [Burkholderiales bacterium]
MKTLKFLLYGVAGLIALGAVTLGVAVAVVDGQFVKTRLERAMKEKNRTLKIDGVPQLKLFPVLGIALGKASLSEPGSDKSFVSMDSAEVAVRVMPLISGEVAVETLKLSGLKANAVRHKDGSMNFSDLAGAKEKAGGKPGEPPNLRIGEVTVEKVQLAYRDEATGQELNIADLNLKTGRLDGQTPGEVSLSARITGKKPEVNLNAQAAGALRFNLGKAELAFDKFTAQLKGHFDQDSVAAEFVAPKLEVTHAKASGSEVRATIQVKGPQRNIDARALVAAVEGTATALTIQKIALELDAAVAGISAKAKLDASIKANLAKQDLQAEVSGRLDESTLKAKVGLTNFAPLKGTFDASIDRLNVDRYLPPERKEAKSDERIDLAALKGKTVNGKLAVGALVVKRVKLENLKAELKLADGKLEVSPYSANLYGGTLTGALTADSNGNRIQVKETAQNVAIGALLRDAAQKDMLEGRGNVSLDVQTAGGTVTALRKALAGSARIEMKDGAIKGINLAESARNAKATLGAKQTKADPSQKTDFTEMSASFKIAKGVAHNDDLKALSPFLRLGGVGDLDIGNNTIDYLAKATLAATAKGQGGREAGQVAGITIPVKLTGALDNPQWNVDYSALLGSSVGAVTESVKKGAAGVGDAVRGLFKR